VAIVPGWHSTIFPPYFVAGAIYSGFGMVLTIAIPLRAIYRLHNLVTLRHIDAMAKFMLVSGIVVTYSYLMETFVGWYSGNIYEQASLLNRAFGPYAPWYWTLIFCNVVVAQSLWFKRVRTSLPLLFVVSLLINFGMWVERFVIVITSLHRDYMPSAWGLYYPTVWDLATLFGTLGLFVALMFLFIRLLPMIPAFEVRRMIAEEPSRSGQA
jgi:Ni/Fe-hydrogenase subunit HybB-like protein